MKQSSDEILALLADHGARLHALLVRLTLREDVAEDLMQDLFLKLAHSHRFTRAGDPVGYVFRVAMNLAFDWRRKQKKSPPVEPLVDEPPASDPPVLSDMLKRERLERVLDAVSRLRGRDREIVVKRHLEQQDFETIAKQLGKTPHQVRALCHKALGRLRRLLDDKYFSEIKPGGPRNDP